MMLFVVCQKCGAVIEESGVLMLAKHFPWNCPACGEVNAPANSAARETVIDFDEDHDATDNANPENTVVLRKLL